MLQGSKVGNSSLVQKAKYPTVPPPTGSVTEHIVHITTKDGRIVREYLFEDEFDFLIWHSSLKTSACTSGGSEAINCTKSGWVSARRSSNKPWKRQYLVLSHCVLNCYAEEPHELLEHIMLQGSKVGNSSLVQKAKYPTVPPPTGSVTEHIVHITTKDGRIVREYLFEDEFDFLIWHASLKKSACALGSEEINCTKSPSDLHNPSSTASVEITPTVDVVVNVCTEYKVCTLDPSGIESEDTWVPLRTTFVQKLSLTGGPNGRISRGDEVVQLEML